MMQNPLTCIQDPSEEDDISRSMREHFWNALSDVKL